MEAQLLSSIHQNFAKGWAQLWNHAGSPDHAGANRRGRAGKKAFEMAKT
jgi:hypothetical protein